MQLLAKVEAEFRVPAGGGRPTDPRWTEWRLVPLGSWNKGRLDLVDGKIGRSRQPD